MGLFRRRKRHADASPPPSSAQSEPDRTELDRLAAEFAVEVERETPRFMAEVERDAARLVAESDAEHGTAASEPGPEPEPEPPTGAPLVGPSWMPADEWADHLNAYRRQGRTDADIRKVAAHLERRGPRKPRSASESAARAASLGTVSRAEYLDSEAEARALDPGPDGLPDARLERVRDRLLVVTPHGWVNPRSRTAASRAGLWSVVLRGGGYHESALKRGDFRPGAEVRLVREPDNPHDPNAIAVYASGARDVSGYVPRGYAKRLANLIDGGADLVALSVRGSGRGSDTTTPHLLICERRLYEHLTRE